MNVRYRIRGGEALHGSVTLSGAKNAALPLLAGSLLIKGVSVFHNVPRLRDITTLIAILEFLGATVEQDGNTVRIDATNVTSKPIPHDLVSRLRGSIVLLGPLLARFGEVEMAFPGGCVLGKRPVFAHVEALEQLGAINKSTDNVLRLEGKLTAAEVTLPEFSVTATENVMMAAALLPGTTRIHMSAYEPHVHDLVDFLNQRGAKVVDEGNHVFRIDGTPDLQAGEHTVISDYLEAGAFVLAALITKGDVTIHGARQDDLTSFLHTIRRAGGIIEWQGDDLKVYGSQSNLKAVRVQTNIFPGFPTDLQAPMGVLLTQAQGVSRIFEVLYEGRMAYLYELEKMGAHIEILNAHQALIIGPTTLRGRTVASNDIRAGVAMVIAALSAEGETELTDVQYIERGYEDLPEKLSALGAEIERLEDKTPETADRTPVAA